MVAISYDDAIRILTDFLREQGYHQPLKAEEWLKDLLKHHLIQIGADNKIEFRHQLIQEYYAAENLLQQISNLSDEELRWGYLNYLKWTEPLALMVGLTENEELALRVVKLALQVDWQLGARLAGAVKLELQEKSIDLIGSLGLPQLLEIHLLTISKLDAAVPKLIKFIENEESNIRGNAVYALGEIKSKQAVYELIKLLQHEDSNVRIIAVHPLAEIQSKQATAGLVQLIDDKDSQVRNRALYALVKNNILNSLNWLQQQTEKDPEATVFIYYSGHGCLDESGEYYLIPHETDRVDVTNTALPAAKFNAALQQIRAKRLFVVIDSCHAQGMASSKDSINKNSRPSLPKGFTQTALPKNFINELKQGTGRVVFTSSTGNQSSWIRPDGAMSIYTYHFLEALRGAANQPGDKVVRVSHLMNHLGKTVSESAVQLCKAEQTPFFDFACEDFPVALLNGGKGLINQGNDQVRVESKTINLDSNTINELMEILKPFMESENSRRPFLILALGSQAPVLQRITWSGTVADFIPNMVDKLAGYGKVSSGKQALWVLLEYARSQMGIDVQQRIDNLRSILDI